MKKSIVIATLLVVGGGATGASAALTIPYQGSDTLFNVTRTAIDNTRTGTNTLAPAAADPGIGPSSTYIGGGSGNGQSAMAAAGGPVASATQQTAPMSRMVNNGSSACKFNGDTTGTGVNLKSASGIVIGLDAVDVLASKQNGAQAIGTCNLLPNGSSANGNAAVAWAAGDAAQTWKWALALIYGGKDLSSSAAPVDCNSAARLSLVNNYTNFIQGTGCSPNASPPTGSVSGSTALTACGTGSPANGRLWHAFRRDEASGTSDVFSSLIGISPSTSNSAVNGFGTSPYCNAINWDTRTGGGIVCVTNADCTAAAPAGTGQPDATCSAAGTCQVNENCVLGGTKQWTGPGGVHISPDDGIHRRPPPGTWGDSPDPGQTSNAADVFATQMQDNDPIRRTCIGGTTNNHLRAGEEVCNLDGALGLVLPMVDSDWILSLPAPNNKQFATNACTGFTGGKAPSVLTCPVRNASKHSGECPNGDSLIGGACSVPVDAVNGTSQCVATSASIAPIHSRVLGNAYGRNFNSGVRDGTIVSPLIGYAQYPIPAAVPPTTQDYTGAYNRIHQVETVLAAVAPGCQLVDMTDQIGCLVAEDPCSIGYAGDGSKSWTQRPNGFVGTSTDPVGTWDVDAMNVAGVAANQTNVQLLGQPGEYQFSRKLYMNSLVGFANVAATTADPGAADELALAVNESVGAFINPILTPLSFFPLGAQATNGQLCEDLNEVTICGNAGPNVNGCLGNPAPIPGAAAGSSTVCGNGVREAFEECDGTDHAPAGHCSATCRCTLDYNNAAFGGTGGCN